MNDRPTSAALDGAAHVMVSVSQGQNVSGYRIIDLAGGYRPLTKELSFRAVAAHPECAGAPWRPSAKLVDAHGDHPSILVSALLADPAHREPLAAVSMQVDAFDGVARQIARQLGITGTYYMHVQVLNKDAPEVAEWAARTANDDFELIDDASDVPALPDAFHSGPPTVGTRRSIRAAGTWLHCVFTRQAFDQFIVAASQQTAVERSWAAIVSIHITADACCVLIERLVEMPGASGREFVITSGSEFYSIYQKFGGKLGGFCHLHPPTTADGHRLGPLPSAPDACTAWNIDAATHLPIVCPIALFGTSDSNLAGNVAAYGYVNGRLAEIDLEVTQ